MRTTVADRLRSGGNLLVGRSAETERLDALLDPRRPDRPSILHVHGPGGVGKTALLREFERRAAERGAPTSWLDGADVEATADGLLAALGSTSLAGLLESLPPGAVVIIDRYEALAAVDPWIWAGLLPALPADALLVLAGRSPPRDVDGALLRHGIVELLPLRNLPPDEAADLLRAHGIPAAVDVTPLVRESYGHPLALVIAADRWAARNDTGTDTGTDTATDVGPRSLVHHPDPAARLLGRFVDDVDDPVQRRALDVAGHARRLDRVLLREALGVDGAVAEDLIGWLRARPYAEVHPDGLALHDVVRDALDADLRWRDPEEHRRVHHGVRTVLLERLRHGDPTARQRAATDLLFLHRSNPVFRSFYGLTGPSGLRLRPVTEDEHARSALDLMARAGGPGRTAVLAHWLRLQPERISLAVDRSGTPFGLNAYLRADLATAEQRAADPVLRAAWAAACERRPVASDEAVLYGLALDTANPERLGGLSDLVAARSLLEWSVPHLGWHFLCAAHESWEPLMTYIGFEPLTPARLEDGTEVTVWARDYARSSYDQWLEEMSAHEIDETGTLPAPVATPVAWSRPDFEVLVLDAVHDLHRPDRLARSPLLKSALVSTGAGLTGSTVAVAADTGLDTVAAAQVLRAVFVEAVATIEEDPATQRAARAVDRTYLRKASTQEGAAELLGMPFSTYRRHLAKGLAGLTELLWEWELHGVPGGRGSAP